MDPVLLWLKEFWYWIVFGIPGLFAAWKFWKLMLGVLTEFRWFRVWKYQKVMARYRYMPDKRYITKETLRNQWKKLKTDLNVAKKKTEEEQKRLVDFLEGKRDDI